MHARQRMKNWALFSLLLALSALFFFLTIIKLSGR